MEVAEKKDPRILFSAERSLLAWNRTSISLMAFGFVIERFGLAVDVAGGNDVVEWQRHLSFFIGLGFILLAAFLTVYSIVQFRRILRMVPLRDLPPGYNVNVGMLANGIIGCLGVCLAVYLLYGFI